MIARLKAAALSVFIGVGAIAAVPATASAEGIYLNYGIGAGAQFGTYDRVDYRNRPHYDRHGPRGCTANRAVNKAERYGVRRARVVDVSRRTITVAGRKWGNRVRMTFSRAPNCPIVRW